MGKIFTFLFLLGGLWCCAQTVGKGHKPDTTQNKGLKAQDQNKAINEEDTGTVYALIAGISRYEHIEMPQLHYADSDAVYFSKLLRSGILGQTDSANIRLLLNEKAATEQNLRAEISWITRRLKPGDKVYIFLSGHGDATSPESVYFLTNQTPRVQDPSEYMSVSAFRISELIDDIKILTVQKKAKVFLITDFCRSNELMGKDNTANFLFKSVMKEEIPGLTRMTSCKADQLSQEDRPDQNKKWNGHGAFSFYLVNGLLGEADDKDKPNNIITLEKLKTYVTENVKRDTRSPSTNEPLQVPYFSDDDQQLCRVDEKIREQLITVKNVDHSLVAYTKKGMVDLHVDSSIYASFESAIKEQRLIVPRENNAVYYFQQLLGQVDDEIKREDLTDELLVALLNKGQEPINYYAQGLLDSIKFNYDYFMNASRYFDAALPYLAQNKELFDRANASRLFLQARALKEHNNKDDWQKGLLLVDSALALRNWAYLYHTKGILYYSLRQFRNAEFYQRKAMSLAPEWAFPYYSISDVFHRENKEDSAYYYYYIRGQKLSPNAYPQEKFDNSRIFGLVVGISNYEHFPKLYAADKDASYFAQLLYDGNLGEVDSNNISLLLNDKATESNIYSELYRIMHRMKKQDNVYLYLSGSGGPVKNKSKFNQDPSIPCFFSYNAVMLSDTNGTVPNGALPLERLLGIIDTIKLKTRANVYLISDFSFSTFTKNEKPESEMDTNALADYQGVTIMQSCINGQMVPDDPMHIGHGAFTYFLVNGLRGAADKNNNGYVSIAELSDYVVSHVEKSTEGQQTPCFFGEWHKVMSKTDSLMRNNIEYDK